MCWRWLGNEWPDSQETLYPADGISLNLFQPEKAFEVSVPMRMLAADFPIWAHIAIDRASITAMLVNESACTL